MNNTINESTSFTPHVLMFGINKDRHLCEDDIVTTYKAEASENAKSK